MPNNFHQTIRGQRFYSNDVPRIVEALEKIADNLEKIANKMEDKEQEK